MFISLRLACLAPAFASILLFLAISDVYSWSTDYPGLLQEPGIINTNSRTIQADTLPAPQAIDSLLQLDEIRIQSTRIREPLRYQPVDVQYIDSLRLAYYRSMPVSAVLSRYSSLFIRDNGPGGLAALSQRGLASSQTQVLWEGFPLNSLSLGLADLSIIPSGLFSSVEVSPGTPSSAFGGGNLGGAIYLTSPRPGQQNRLEFMQSAGSYDTWNSQLRAAHEEGNLSLSVQGIYRTAENDFSYFNRATGRQERRTHNAGRSGHLSGTASYRFSRTRIHSTLWYFDIQEEIPGSILSGSSRATQSNHGLRWLSGVETSAGSWNLNMRTFLERDRFGYEDPPTGIDSRFRLGRTLADVDFRRPALGPVLWQGGLSGGIENVDTNNYGDEYNRRQLAFRLNPEIRFSSIRLRFSPTARVDAYSDFGWVLSPSFGANWEAVEERFHLRGMVSRDFNPPSFNDLYWVPGGNPGLNPERSFKTEGGFVYLPEVSWFDSFSLTTYRIWLDDGIYWFPDREGVWTPSNVEEVDAWGAEARLDVRWQADPALFLLILGTDWRKSEIASPRFPDDQAAGRQMRYVPEWSFRSDLSIHLNPVTLHLNYRWTDHRYITEDHTSSLDDFQVLDVIAAVDREFIGAHWNLRLSVNNLLNERYEIIQWYPMPGRYLELSLRMGLPM